MRTAIVFLVAMILTTVTCALLGIWLWDGRWGLTALVSFLLTVVSCGVIAALLDEVDKRR